MKVKREDTNELPIVNPDISLVDEMQDALNPLTGLNIKTIDPYEEKDYMIILLGKTENKFGIAQKRYKIKETQDQDIILTPFDEMGTPEAREDLAEFIVQMHEKDIRAQAVEVVKTALKRKPLKTLQKLKQKTQEKKKGKLKTKTGCVYFEVGEESVLL